MCFLKIYSKSNSFKEFAGKNSLPIYSVYDKGERCGKNKNEVYTDFVISFDVSDKEWDEFPAQVDDAIEFLTSYFSSLQSLFKSHEIDDAYLDFPLYSRLNTEIINQNDHLPRELIAICGRLNVGIEMAIYSTDVT